DTSDLAAVHNFNRFQHSSHHCYTSTAFSVALSTPTLRKMLRFQANLVPNPFDGFNSVVEVQVFQG
ncbi:MAG: hypothetical protein ACXWKG_09720, partial [Limisphaerales bacterium]